MRQSRLKSSEADEFHMLSNDPSTLRLRYAFDFKAKANISLDREPRKQRVVLKNHRSRPVRRTNWRAIKRDLPAGRTLKPSHDIQERRFAAAGMPEQAAKLMIFHYKIYIAKRNHVVLPVLQRRVDFVHAVNHQSSHLNLSFLRGERPRQHAFCNLADQQIEHQTHHANGEHAKNHHVRF